MARRSGSPSRGSPAFGRGRSPSPTASRRPAPQSPAQAPKSLAPQSQGAVSQPAPTAMSPGGGLMANVASTAAGVAIGHTVGHALTGALGIGGGGGHSEPAVVDQSQVQSSPQHQLPHQQNLAGQDPCKFELDQFLVCAQNQASDLSLCDGFNQVLRECKTRYGQMYQ